MEFSPTGFFNMSHKLNLITTRRIKSKELISFKKFQDKNKNSQLIIK